MALATRRRIGAKRVFQTGKKGVRFIAIGRYTYRPIDAPAMLGIHGLQTQKGPSRICTPVRAVGQPGVDQQWLRSGPRPRRWWALLPVDSQNQSQDRFGRSFQGTI